MSRRVGLGRLLWDSYILQSRGSNHAHRRNELSRAGSKGAWRRWKRDKNIVALLPMVGRIARSVRWMFALYIDVRDLEQAGSVGLVNAANCYDPARGAFEPYAWFRVRGAIIDSQKRKVYREELNVSLQSISDAHDGWLPPALDTDRGPLPDALAEGRRIMQALHGAIEKLPDLERRALRGHLAGESLSATAKGMARSLAATRVTLADARHRVGVIVRGRVA
jgi:RNA polymerase sigma factor (sigma-70 family)